MGMYLLVVVSYGASLMAEMIKNPPAMQETWAQSLDQKEPLKKGIATLSSNLAWRIPWSEMPGELQFMGHRVRYN